MALGLTLDCPIDGLPLVGTISSQVKGGAADRTSHMHIEFRAALLTCANLHEWSLDGEQKLYRGSRELAPRTR